MGHKVNPVGLRLGVNRTWDSRWYSDAQYRHLLLEDIKIREFLHKRLKQAGVSKIVIERHPHVMDAAGKRHHTIRAIPYQDPQQEAERLKAVHEARVKIVPRV